MSSSRVVGKRSRKSPHTRVRIDSAWASLTSVKRRTARSRVIEKTQVFDTQRALDERDEFRREEVSLLAGDPDKDRVELMFADQVRGAIHQHPQAPGVALRQFRARFYGQHLRVIGPSRRRL